MLTSLGCQLRRRSAISITPLAAIVTKAHQEYQELPNMMREAGVNVFRHGMDPDEFRTQLVVYYHFHLYNSKTARKLRSFLSQKAIRIAELTAKGFSSNNMNEEWLMLQQYTRKLISTTLAYVVAYDESTVTAYIKQLSLLINQSNILKGADLQYAENEEWCIRNGHVTTFELTFILENIWRILFTTENKTISLLKERDTYWEFIEILPKILDIYVERAHLMPPPLKLNLMEIALRLRIYHYRFAQLILEYVEDSRNLLGLQAALSAVNYLGSINCFPYELFYRNRANWLNILSSFDLFHNVKICLIKNFLEIFTTQRLFFCEETLMTVLDHQRENLPAMKLDDIAKMLLTYSKVKFGPHQEFLDSVASFIKQRFDEINPKSFTRIVKAIAYLEYHDPQLIAMLRQHDQQQLEVDLTEETAILSQYFMLILTEIEESKIKSGRQYFFDDR